MKYFSRYVPRRIGAEALLDAVCDATGVPEKFKGFPAGHAGGATAGRRVPVPVPAGVRPPAAGERVRVRAGHRHDPAHGPDAPGRRLHPVEADAPTGRVAALAASKLTDREVVEEMFPADALPPADGGRVAAASCFPAGAKQTRQQRYEDVMHALLNHPEFLSSTDCTPSSDTTVVDRLTPLVP